MADTPRWLKQLRSAGGLAGAVATALTILGANWGVAMSAAIAIVAVIWADFFKFANDPHIQTAASVFLWTLWTYIALSILYRLHNGIKTSPVVDYAFGIMTEEMTINIDKEEDGNLQVGINLRNVCNGAIRLQLTEARVVIDGRTHPEREPLRPIVLPRLATKGIVVHPISKKDLKPGRLEGSLDFTVEYGPHDGAPVRKFRGRFKLTVVKTPEPPWGFGNELISEEDVPI